MDQLIEKINQDLLPQLDIESLNPYNPVVVNKFPQPWQLLGTGNYAAVFYHPDYADVVVKIYAPGREGWKEEVEVYHRIGSHWAFSECFYAQEDVLVLKRLYGITLYDCLHQGYRIPSQVIKDIDEALEYARGQGLNPRDVHGRNVMMSENGRGLVVDISDFLEEGESSTWNDLRRAYYGLYRPFFSWHRLKVSYVLLDFVRKGYRFFRRSTRR